MSPFVSVVHCGWICCGSHSERGTSVPASSRGRQMEWCYRSVTNIVTFYFPKFISDVGLNLDVFQKDAYRPLIDHIVGGVHGMGEFVWRTVCVAGGIHGRRGHVWQGVCMAGGHAWHACPPENRMTDACKTLPCRKLRLRVVTSMDLAWLTHTHSYKISLWVVHLRTNGKPQIHLWVLYSLAGINV